MKRRTMVLGSISAAALPLMKVTTAQASGRGVPQHQQPKPGGPLVIAK